MLWVIVCLAGHFAAPCPPLWAAGTPAPFLAPAALSQDLQAGGPPGARVPTHPIHEVTSGTSVTEGSPPRDERGSGRTAHSTVASQGLCSLCWTLGPITRAVGAGSPRVCHTHSPSTQPRGGQGSACGRTAVLVSTWTLEPGFSGHVGCSAGWCCWGQRGGLGTAGTCPHALAEVPPEAVPKLLCSAYGSLGPRRCAHSTVPRPSMAGLSSQVAPVLRVEVTC